MKLKLKHLFVAISSLLMSSCTNTISPSPSHNSDDNDNSVAIENNEDSTHFAVSGDENYESIIEAPEYPNNTYLRGTL